MGNFVRSLAETIGPGPAVLLIALTAGGACWAVGGAIILLWRRR